jgi:glycosyltransferase involved in cell wall biosynthesis
MAIGQFPPPLSGFSFITAAVVKALRDTCPVDTFDIAAPKKVTGVKKHASRILATGRACVGVIRARGGKSLVCYVACEGGLGLIYTLAVMIAALLRRLPIFLHHHSFAYIDRKRPIMQAILAIEAPVTHIFLCEMMRDAFEARYGRKTRSIILSNAAFVPLLSAPCRVASEANVVLGHLSNLTREKGLYTFLALIRRAIAAGLNVRAILAGPAELPEDRAAIEKAQGEFGAILDYRGPVYGREKDRFYQEIDAFIFPTTYVNEAQPTVLFEAQAAGCMVAAFDRGCIAQQVGAFGLVVSRQADFVEACLSWLSQTDCPAASRIERRVAIRDDYDRRHKAMAATLHRLFEIEPASAR